MGSVVSNSGRTGVLTAEQGTRKFDERGLFMMRQYEELNERQIDAMVSALKEARCLKDYPCKSGLVPDSFQAFQYSGE